jgi:hypothetical protein
MKANITERFMDAVSIERIYFLQYILRQDLYKLLLLILVGGTVYIPAVIINI